MYTIALWWANPDLDNDACETGMDFPTREEAEECWRHIVGTKNTEPYMKFRGPDLWIEIDGPDVNKSQQVYGRTPTEIRQEEENERREFAMEMGMGLGIDAYNDAMGW